MIRCYPIAGLFVFLRYFAGIALAYLKIILAQFSDFVKQKMHMEMYIRRFSDNFFSERLSEKHIMQESAEGLNHPL